MIKDKILPILVENFSKESFHKGVSPDSIAIFNAKHESVGDVSIQADGEEVIISIGDITHGHFSSFEPDLTQNEIEEDVAEQVVNFLNDLFADKYLLFKSGGYRGWRHLDYVEEPFKVQENTEYFVWSGPFNVGNLQT